MLMISEADCTHVVKWSQIWQREISRKYVGGTDLASRGRAPGAAADH